MCRCAARDVRMRRAARVGVEALEPRVVLSATLTPTADTFARNHEYRSTNFGASPVLGVKTASSGDARTAFLRFDIGDVGANVVSATLRLTASLQNPEGGPAVTGAFGVEDVDWIEGDGQWAYRDRSNGALDTTRRITGHGDGYDRDATPAGEMTWNNQPASDTVPIDTISVGTDLARTYDLDVTSYVLAARRAGERQLSLALKNPQATDFFTRILSREFPDGQPTLIITQDGETASPLASISAPDISATSGAAQQVTVTFDGAGIDGATVGADDLVVLDPAGHAVAVSGVTTVTHGNALTATFTVAAPGGAWDSLDNGVYRATVKPGAVSGAGGASVRAMQEFRVAVDDAETPTVTIIPVAPQAGETTFTFSATFQDDVAIDPTTINLNNFQIDAPNGTGLGFTHVTVTPDTASKTVLATFTTEAPGGPDNIGWRPEFDGTWTITLRDNQVRDMAGRAVARTAQTFQVNLSASDATGPAATITAGDVTSAGGSAQTLRVDYSDPAGVDVSTFGVSDLTVTGPGGAALDVISLSLAGGATATTRGVFYTVVAPGGSWDAADAGVYTVALRSGEVKDANGNPAVRVTATFNVQPVSPDTTGPAASVAANTAVTEAGTAPVTITVTYTDNVAVDATSIGPDDLTVSGPGGDLDVTGAAVTANGGSTLTASYTVSPPAGGFAVAANGVYAVNVVAGAVRDTAGNPVAASSGQLDVAISGAADPRDPTFSAEAVPFSAQGVATQSDGKLVVVGYLGAAGSADSRAVIQRRNPDGTPDTTFGTDGTITSPAGAGDAYYAVVVQSGDQIVTAGERDGNFVLTRYTPTGSLDATFGSGGSAVADFGQPDDAAYALTESPDGKLVAAGGSAGHFAVARFTLTGVADTTFAQGGRQLFAVDDDSDGLGAVAVQRDGKVVAVGARGAAVAVIRLNSNGEADPGFSADGLLLVGGLTAARGADQRPDHSQAVVVQPDGRIVVSNRTPEGDFGLARITPGGNLDSTFGDNGLAVASFGGEADVDALVVQGTGQILAIGTVLAQGGAIKTGVAAFDSDGRLITGFGENGTVTIDANVIPAERELHVGDLVLRAFGTRQADGRLVVGTANEAGAATRSSLSRLLVPGSSAVLAPGPSETLVGTFGIVDGRKTKVPWTDADGTVAQLILTGASGTAFSSAGNTSLRLAITDLGPGAKLTVKLGGGGDGRITLGDVGVTGALKSIAAKGVDLAGILFASGAIGKVMLRNVSGGTIASAAGSIGTVAAASINNALVLSGANLGVDGRIGGGDDSFAGGTIRSVKVMGTIAASVIGAGYDPGSDVDFLDDPADNGVAAGSSIFSIVARGGADSASRFAASRFGSVKIPAKVDPATDSRFDLA